ncbi:hypothetical protein [Allokutzneria sp. NRRL B-24872]|uniref:hypothetical protein n=1 Tax=Allokutzneria sp. NRRL B-24872 TaxID=1137961 RepID=UPI0011780424|nr:hypothetical protein [Allokutzneria sp. NRRL B-24872]
MKTKLAGAVVVLAAVAGGVAMSAPAAGAATAQQGNCNVWFLTGATAPNVGVRVRCDGLGGRYFKAEITCKRNDNGYRYNHYGNRVEEGSWSTVWCDRDATIVHWGGVHA